MSIHILSSNNSLLIHSQLLHTVILPTTLHWKASVYTFSFYVLSTLYIIFE